MHWGHLLLQTNYVPVNYLVPMDNPESRLKCWLSCFLYILCIICLVCNLVPWNCSMHSIFYADSNNTKQLVRKYTLRGVPGFGSWISSDKHPPSEAPPAEDWFSFTDYVKWDASYVILYNKLPLLSFLPSKISLVYDYFSYQSSWCLHLHSWDVMECLLVYYTFKNS